MQQITQQITLGEGSFSGTDSAIDTIVNLARSRIGEVVGVAIVTEKVPMFKAALAKKDSTVKVVGEEEGLNDGVTIVKLIKQFGSLQSI